MTLLLLNWRPLLLFIYYRTDMRAPSKGEKGVRVKVWARVWGGHSHCTLVLTTLSLRRVLVRVAGYS
jgi:hypothetical protein